MSSVCVQPSLRMPAEQAEFMFLNQMAAEAQKIGDTEQDHGEMAGLLTRL